MSYWILLLIILLIILIIVADILFTISIDNLARVPSPDDPVILATLNNVVSLGSYIVILLIFLLALLLTIAILVYYNIQRNVRTNLPLYLMIISIFTIIGVIIISYYTYTNFLLLNNRIPTDIYNTNINYFFWAIIILILSLFLSLFLPFIY